MYVKIETNGATDILINVPQKDCADTLPAISSMLEYNSVFIRKAWREMQPVKPTLSIVLDNEIVLDGGDSGDIIIKSSDSDCVISKDFVPLSQDVLISYKAVMDKKESAYQTVYKKAQYLEDSIKDKDGEIEKLSREIERLKGEIGVLTV